MANKKIRLKLFLKDLFCRFVDDDLLALAGQLSYSLLLSFFPFIIFLSTIVGYSSVSSGDVLSVLHRIMPESAYKLVVNTVVDIVESRNSNLLSFSLVVTLWSGSSGFRAVMKGLNRAYDEEEQRPIWKIWAISIICIFAIALIIILAFMFLVFGDFLGKTIIHVFDLSISFKSFWNYFRYLVMFLTTVLIFAELFHFTPSRRLSFMEVLPGAFFTTIGWIAASIGFSIYVNNFANYSRYYGGLGAVIVLMVWLYIVSIMILVGGEINASLAFLRDGKEKYRCKRF